MSESALVRCSEENSGWVYQIQNGKLHVMASAAHAAAVDPNWQKNVVSVPCLNRLNKDAYTTTFMEGEMVMCVDDGPNAPGVYRIMNGVASPLPSEAVAASWDNQWQSDLYHFTCGGLPRSTQLLAANSGTPSHYTFPIMPIPSAAIPVVPIAAAPVTNAVKPTAPAPVVAPTPTVAAPTPVVAPTPTVAAPAPVVAPTPTVAAPAPVVAPTPTVAAPTPAMVAPTPKPTVALPTPVAIPPPVPVAAAPPASPLESVLTMIPSDIMGIPIWAIAAGAGVFVLLIGVILVKKRMRKVKK